MIGIEMNEPKIDMQSKIVKSNHYITLNNVNHKIYIPKPENIDNHVTCFGYIIKIEDGAYEPDSWIHSIQVLSCDIKTIN